MRERALLRKGARPFGIGHVHLDLVAEEDAPFLKRARPFGKRALPKCHNEL
jgi:hypothetical protein